MQDIAAGDVTAKAYLALPEAGTGPGVLVLHAWWGLVPTFTEVCDRLAAAGFVALAPDLYDGRTATTVDEAEALMQASDRGRMGAIALAALGRLRQNPAVTGPAIGIVGFSMGASWALRLNELQPEAVAAVVDFYGISEMDWSVSRAAFQGHFAAHDQFEALDDVHVMEEAIRAAGREVEFYVYPGASHWFFEADRPEAYDAEAARVAWERTKAFLHRTL